MSNSMEEHKIDNMEFKWGIKRGRGGMKKDVQFYESFTFDGVEYFLYDAVYLFKDGELDPYVGKLIKIWEHANKTKRVKILWFFRPYEVSNYLGDAKVLENELFLASGEGTGLTNINPLEAIAGKCNVVCISKDERNRQPSVEELKMADHMFFRTFDVEKLAISDKLGEKIATVEVKYLLNKNGSQKPCPLNTDAIGNGNTSDATASLGKGVFSQKSHSGMDKAVKHSEYLGSSLVKEFGGADVMNKQNFCAEEKREVTEDAGIAVGAVSAAKTNAVSGQSTLKHAAVTEVQKSAKDVAKSNSSVIQKTNIDRINNLSESEDKSTVRRTGIGSGINSLKDAAEPTVCLNNEAKSELLKNSRRLIEAAEIKSNNDAAALEARPSKKLKFEDTSKPSNNNSRNITQKLAAGHDANGVKASLAVTVAENRSKGKLAKDSNAAVDVLSMMVKPRDAATKLSNEKLHKATKQLSNKDAITYGLVVEVTRRPDADKSKWFTGLPWEDRMKTACEQGRLVLLQNLDPAYASSEVEDIVWHGCRESCTAKMLQHTAISSPHSGQAFAIFKTREAAENVIKKLERGCLMLPNGRPLVSSVGVASYPPKQSPFPGHLVIDKLKLQMQKEKKEAVSTSHSSQPNTLEYDMGMEWRLLQARSEFCWKKLYKQQGEELKKLKANLKSK
ncbi:hypothetical protein Ancab_022799 [Ancistrocladus abbreviatus]